ncbi:MAG: branched-chain amino acid ABC transporter permease [Desulfobacula sp.]|nr:branched-chain amino acid ABC transporter permease [Desulfobacula sp.]
MKTESRFRETSLWATIMIIFGLVPVFMTSTYQMNLASHILIWILFATAFNMLWGLTGMLSFGQALYYGLGAYFVGLMVKYLGSAWFFPGMAIGLVASAIIALLIGLLLIRVGGVYFTMLTLAFAQLMYQIMFKWYNFTGGDDGVVGIMQPGIFSNPIVYYYFILGIVIASIWTLKRIAYSPFGMVLRCVNQNPDRVRFLGRRVRRNQLRIYIVSSVFVALAGGLMVGVDNSIHTDMFVWTTSGEVILMTVLGGINQFFGPFVGAIALILIEDIVGAYTEYWSLIIGTIVLIMVLLFPKGLVGEFLQLKHRFLKLKKHGG